MKVFFDDAAGQQADTIIILSKKESEALIDIIAGYVKTKPNKRSKAYKLADDLDNRLLA